MVKELMHDPIFLAGKSEAATKGDLQVAQDLLDTLMEHRESCVGMAANMIGVRFAHSRTAARRETGVFGFRFRAPCTNSA
jgi:peptide deformylase